MGILFWIWLIHVALQKCCNPAKEEVGKGILCNSEVTSSLGYNEKMMNTYIIKAVCIVYMVKGIVFHLISLVIPETWFLVNLHTYNRVKITILTPCLGDTSQYARMKFVNAHATADNRNLFGKQPMKYVSLLIVTRYDSKSENFTTTKIFFEFNSTEWHLIRLWRKSSIK